MNENLDKYKKIFGAEKVDKIMNFLTTPEKKKKVDKCPVCDFQSNEVYDKINRIVKCNNCGNFYVTKVLVLDPEKDIVSDKEKKKFEFKKGSMLDGLFKSIRGY